ncbi:MAG: alpha/beta fold hydrolase [Deltaproteobacteria bacterium]|nr:alpha/beta fold hydrolase [Deltaproteobacteria bacterium]
MVNIESDCFCCKYDAAVKHCALMHSMTGLNLPKPYDGDEHKSFSWQAGDHAAVLFHGFPGTPAEMRPLGTVLWKAGWTVHGVMLPGLGADIATLEERSFKDWTQTAKRTVDEVKKRHRTVILIGYSMGGALALHTALEQRLAGLILLAPFWSFGEGWLRILWPFIRVLFRHVTPLKHADFTAREVRQPILRMFQNIDLDNPQTQQALRRITLSSKSIAQVHKLGRSAYQRASRINVPTLIIQGAQDKVVRPEYTSILLSRLPNRPLCQHVDATHDLIDPQQVAWKTIESSLLKFAVSVTQ